MHVNERVCKHINQRLGVTATYDTNPPRDDVTMTTTPFIGTYTAASIIADTPAVIDGHAAGCFEGGGTPAVGTYHFYQTLHIR